MTLYGGLLPAHAFTLQRAKHSAGFFSPNRWQNLDRETQLCEIALNPVIFSNRPLWRLFQTIVREQCHLWQHTFGKPARPGYHNSEWADKMEAIGLLPTSTGSPGGARTGQKLATYPLPDGPFVVASASLIRSGFHFPWVDTGEAPPSTQDLLISANVDPRILASLNAPLNAQSMPLLLPSDASIAKKKINYRCKRCRTNVWGKPGILILCGCCSGRFEAVA